MEFTKRSLVSVCALLAAVAVSAAIVTGCSDDKPQYCSDVSSLEDSVNQLTSIEINSEVVDTVQSDLETVRSDAEAVVASAQSDFPTETSELEDSVDRAVTAVEDLPSSPSAADVAALAADVVAVGNAATSFQDATSSACD